MIRWRELCVTAGFRVIVLFTERFPMLTSEAEELVELPSKKVLSEAQQNEMALDSLVDALVTYSEQRSGSNDFPLSMVRKSSPLFLFLAQPLICSWVWVSIFNLLPCILTKLCHLKVEDSPPCSLGVWQPQRPPAPWLCCCYLIHGTVNIGFHTFIHIYEILKCITCVIYKKPIICKPLTIILHIGILDDVKKEPETQYLKKITTNMRNTGKTELL